MRLLIYLLAMMTGFSAAEAARSVTAAPATLGSQVSNAAVVAAAVMLSERERRPAHEATLPVLAELATALIWIETGVPVQSPVMVHDVTRQ